MGEYPQQLHARDTKRAPQLTETTETTTDGPETLSAAAPRCGTQQPRTGWGRG